MIKWQQLRLLQPTVKYSINVKKSRETLSVLFRFDKPHSDGLSIGKELIHTRAYRVNKRLVYFINALISIHFNNLPLIPIVV